MQYNVRPLQHRDGRADSGAKLPNRQGEAALEATSNQTIWRQGYRLRFQMTITSQLKEEGDNPTRVYGMECGGVAKAQVENVGMKRTLRFGSWRPRRPAFPIHAVPRYTRPI